MKKKNNLLKRKKALADKDKTILEEQKSIRKIIQQKKIKTEDVKI